MQNLAEFEAQLLGGDDVIAVRLRNHDAIGHLDNSLLDSLQLVTCTGQGKKQKEIGHRAHGNLALTHPDRLNENHVVTRRLAQRDRFARLAVHAAQRAARGRWTDVSRLMARELFHARLVPEDAASGDRACRIHREHGDTVTRAAKVETERLDESALSNTRNAGDADAHGPVAMRQQQLHQLSGGCRMPRGCAFHQSDGPRQNGRIPLAHAARIVSSRKPDI